MNNIKGAANIEVIQGYVANHSSSLCPNDPASTAPFGSTVSIAPRYAVLHDQNGNNVNYTGFYLEDAGDPQCTQGNYWVDVYQGRFEPGGPRYYECPSGAPGQSYYGVPNNCDDARNFGSNHNQQYTLTVYGSTLPGVPTGLYDLGDTDTALTWQWNNPGAQTYIKTASWAYGLSSGWQYGTIGNVNQWQQTSLYNGTHYTLEVSACNSAGCSAWSRMASPDGTTQLVFPTNLAATHDQNDAYLSWQNHTSNPPPNATLNAQWWQYGYSSQWTPVQMANTSVQSWTHANLYAGTKYSYQTFVCTPAVGCLDSNQIDVLTDLTAATLNTAYATDYTHVYLGWQNNANNLPSGASLYAGWYQYASGGGWNYVPLSGTSLTSTTQSANAGIHYAWQIAVCTPATGCVDSNYLDVTTPMPAPSPYVSSATSNSITTSWANPASTTTGYYIAKSYNYGAYGAYTPIGNVTSYTDSGLSPGTWSYIVSACTQYVCSASSSPASWTISSGGAAPAFAPSGTALSKPATPAIPVPQAAVAARPEHAPSASEAEHPVHSAAYSAPPKAEHPKKAATQATPPSPQDPNAVR
ncbi:MAG: hypothetical protein ACR2PL_21955 [Dehalococcoidia bacterium]